MIAVCPTCHRRERHGDGRVVVELEGGARRPAEHPTLAAWRTLRKAAHGGRVVVGACPCGQPLLAEPPAPAVSWVLETPDGPIAVEGAQFTGNAGPLREEEVERSLEAHFGARLRIRPALAAFQGSLMLALLAPIALWVVTLFVVIGFLIGFGTPPGFR